MTSHQLITRAIPFSLVCCLISTETGMESEDFSVFDRNKYVILLGTLY